MNKLIQTLLFVLLFPGVYAMPSDSLKRANELYANEEYAKAIETYNYLVENDYQSAALFYNLGNAHYKNSELTKALLNYERARLLAPNDEDIQYNLDLLNQFVIDKIEPLPQPFFVKWGAKVRNLFNSNTWALISITAFILTLILIIVYIFSRRLSLKKAAFSIAIITLLLSIFAFGFSSKQKEKLTSYDHAIIFNPTVTVKASPSESGIDLFVIHEGLKVEVLQKLGSWIEIKLQDGNSGWVKTEVLEII